MSMTTAEAVAETRKFGAMLRSLARISEIAELAHVFEGQRAETEAHLAKVRSDAAEIKAASDAEVAAKKAEIATLDAAFDKKSGLITQAKAEAEALIAAAKEKASAIEAAAREAAAKAKQDSDDLIAALGADVAKAKSDLAAVKAEVAKASADRDAINADIEEIKRQVRALAG